MLILEALKEANIYPNGRSSNPYSIHQFVLDHFEQLGAVRKKGYSWKQIAYVAQGKYGFKSRNLARQIAVNFYLQTKENNSSCNVI